MFKKIVFLSLIIISIHACKEKSNEIVTNKLSSKNIHSPDKIISIDSVLFQKYTVLEKKLDQLCEMSYPYTLVKANNYFYILNKNSFVINEYDNNFDFIRSIGKRGKGPEEGLEISHYFFNQDTLVILDWISRSILTFKDGKWLEKRLLESSQILPNHISSLVRLDNQKVFITGNNADGWQKITHGLSYQNLFILDLENQKIDSSFSLIPNDILAGIKRGDVISSPVSSAFTIKKLDKLYLFNRSSKFIYRFVLSEKNEIDELQLFEFDQTLFVPHINMSVGDYNTTGSNSTSWFRSGSNMSNLFETEKYIIFYLTSYNNSIEKMQFYLIFCDKKTLTSTVRLDYTLPMYLESLDDDYLYFIRETNNQDSQYEMVIFNYSKLL